MDGPGARGRGGRARMTGRKKQPPLERPDAPVNQAQKNPIQSLVRTATTPSSNAARRVAALQELHKMLRDNDKGTASTVHGTLPVMWLQILGLLGDGNADVRQMAAQVVGMLGAMATRQGARPGVSPGLLFDWALPLLSAQQGSADSSKTADVGSMYWVMTALREGLQHCDDKTVSRYGHALFEACQALLESDDLSVHLLAPLLALLIQAARHIHSLRAHFKDLVDLLLGWSLEPSLPNATRPLLYTAFISFQPIWQEQHSFAAGLLNNLLSDVERLISGQDNAVKIEDLRQILSLSSCITAIIQACSQGALPSIHELLQGFATAMQSAIGRYHTLFHSPSGIPSAAEELCQFLRIILTVALPEHLNSMGGVEAGQATNSASGPSQAQSATALDSNQPFASPTDTAVKTASCMAVLGVALKVLEGAGLWAKSADLQAALHLTTTVLELQGSSTDRGIPEAVLDLLLESNSPFSKLRGNTDTTVMKLVTHTYLSLLQHPRRSTREAALNLVLTDLRAQLDRATEEGAFKDAVSLSTFSLSLLSQETMRSQYAAAIWAGLHATCMPSGPMQMQPLLWVEVLTLLREIASPDHQNVQTNTVDVSQILPFWFNLAISGGDPAVRLLAADWLVASAVAVSQHHHIGDLGDSGNGEEMGAAEESVARSMQQLDVSGAVASSDSSGASSTAARHGITSCSPAVSFSEAAVQAVLALAEAADESLRGRAASFTQRLLAPTGVVHSSRDHAAERGKPDLGKLERDREQGSLTEEQRVRLGQAACEHLSDVSAAVAAQWRGVLSELEPHLARIATGIGTASNPCLSSSLQVRPAWRAELAQQPQRQLLQPQLTRLLDWFTQASPALLIRPQAGPSILTRPAATGAADAAPVRKEADMMEWLVQLPGTCPALDGAELGTMRSPTSQAEAACWAVEESARQCVAARMRTHYGGPAQTFAALEAGLQTRLARALDTTSTPHKGSAMELQSTWLFQEFMVALERQVQAACEGSCALSSPPLPAMSFFSVTKNRKACEEWFARLRPLQLRLAAACGQHGATVFHACLHLLQLERQASALLAPPPAKPHTPAAAPAARHPPAATPAAESAAASAAESAAPLGEAEWPSLGATAAPAAPKETPTKPSAKEAKAAKRQAAKLRQPRKAVPLAVQPRILQRSDEAAPAARPEPASRPGAPKLAGSGMGGKKSAQPAPSADVLARLEKLSREVLSTLRQVCSALCAMGDPDAIAGLHAHAIEAFAGLFAATRVQQATLGWMEGMRCEAGGDYQAAARIYSDTLRSAGTSMRAEDVAFVSSRAAEAYAAIADWNGLDDVSSITVRGAPACMRALAALDRGDNKKAAELFKSWSEWSSNKAEPSADAAASTPRAVQSPRSAPSQAPASVGLSEAVLLKVLLAIQPGSSTVSLRSQIPTSTAGPSSAPDSPTAEGKTVKIISRASRRNRGERHIKAQDTAAAPLNEVPEQDSALTAALSEVRAEQQRLNAKLALASCEGMSACASLLTDSWVASLLCRSLEACLQGASSQQLLRQLSKQVAAAAAGPTPPSQIAPDDLQGLDNAVMSRLGAGGRAADVRPWLQAERILRITAGGGSTGAAERLQGSGLLLDVASAARCSGNQALAAGLLDRVTAQLREDQSPGVIEGAGAAAQQDADQDVQLRLQMERLLLLGSGSMSGGASGQAVQAAALWQILAAVGTEKDGDAGRCLRAEAYMRLASWSSTVPPTELAAVLERASEVSQNGALDSPAKTQPFVKLEGDKARCLSAAVSAAPRGSVTAGKAWAAYADWLFAQHAKHASVGTAAEGRSSLQDAHEPATDSSSGQTAAVQRSAGQQAEEASNRHAVEALHAYCAALECAGLSGGQSGSPEDHIAALLRILQVQAHLLGQTQRHDGAINRAVARVPVSLWQTVTPQLFPYLAHPKEGVRACVSGILIKLETVVPSAVIYPALAALSRTGDKGLIMEAQQVIEPLRQRKPEVLDEAHMFVEEMARVASLWDEQWMHSLQEVQAEVERRIGALQREVAHMQAMQDAQADITNRMAKRFADVMGPAVLLLDQTAAATVQCEPQTPHERAFHATFSTPLSDAIAAFRSSPTPTFKAGNRAAATLLEPLLALSGKIERRCRVSSVKLADVSPRLAALAASVLPIPAQRAAAISVHLADNALPSLVEVEHRVEILGTKTRPKRLWFRGSNGARYSFLLKGREELRLDERLMQLLRCSNAVLRGSSMSALRQLRARTFGVVPLGHRTGLIEWVEHTVPLFGLYQNSLRHSMAAAAEPRSAAAEPSAQPDGPQPVQKVPTPTEAFYSRLIPALKAAGIDSQAPRKKWPRMVVRQVVQDLMSEAPKGMIARDILAGAAGPGDWCARQQAHARSAAVMSMVGWLLGLGDRHLDNILFDNRTGELVHIDYNVVFERGRQLRVPEIVPFRLTQSMQAALGVAGVEGTFRLGAEATLAALRGSEGTLSTVLLSIIDDPFIDLSSGHMSAMHKEADLLVTLKLVRLRVSEAGPLLLPHFGALAQALRAAGKALQQWSPLFQEAAAALQAAERAHKEAVFHQAALTGARARREGTQERMTGAQGAEGQMRHDIGGLRSAMEQGLRECRGWAERHTYTVQKLRSSALQELSLPTEYWLSSASRAPLGLVSSIGNPASRAVVPLALGSAIRPPPNLLGLCAAVDEKAAALLSARDQAMLAATATLQEYAAALQQILPDDYVASSHHARWAGSYVQALGACDSSIGGAISSAAAEGGFQQAWEQAPVESPPGDAVKGYRALCVAADATLSAAAVSQGELDRLSQNASEDINSAEPVRAALLEALQEQESSSFSSAAPAFAEFLLGQLFRIQDRAPQEVLGHLQQLILGLAGVADVAKQAAVLQSSTFLGDDSLLQGLIVRSTCAAEAQARFNLLVAPALVGCAAAGPNAAMLRDAAAINRLRQQIDSILHEAHRMGYQQQEKNPSTAAKPEEGAQQWSPCEESDASKQRLAPEIEGLQQRASACVDQLEALAAAQQAAQSPILPAFGHLHVSLRGFFIDEDRSRQEEEASVLSDVKGWEAAVFAARLMDDLMQACFEQPPSTAQPFPSSQPQTAVPHSPFQESSRPEPQISTAAQEHLEGLSRLQSTLGAALGSHMLRNTSAALARMHQMTAEAVSADPVIPPSAEGLSGLQLEDAALLEADPKLESADQELDRLEQDGPPLEADEAAGLDWLDEAAIQQQEHPTGADSDSAAAVDWGGLDQERRAEASEPYLQPFLDFDDDAGEAEGALEQGTPPAQLPLPGQHLPGSCGSVSPPVLEPFMGFNAGLGGADEPLESGSEGTSSTSSESGSSSSSQHSFSELHADSHTTDEAGEIQAAANLPARLLAGLERQTSAAMQELTGDGERLLSLMKACAEACGVHASAELQKSAVLGALQQAEGQRAANAAALALYEWSHEPDLAAAGVLGPPIEVAPQRQQGWTLRHRRSQLLGALEAALRTLGGLEDALAAWAPHASAAEASLQAAVSPPGEAAMDAAARLGHFLELRQHWLTIASDQSAGLMRLGQAVLQLELSREGKAWTGVSGVMGGCEVYRPLMQQLQLLCTACVAAINEAQTARDELAALNAELAVTAPALEAAAREEHEASSAFASLAAPVLEHSTAAGSACEDALAALERAPLQRMDFIVHDLKHLAAQGVPVENAVRDLARETLQHHRCITAARAALSAALLPLLRSLRTAQQQQQQNPHVSSAAAGQAASLIVAARPHATTAEAQATAAVEAATAAERLRTVLPAVSEAATEAAQALRQPAAARAGTWQQHGGHADARPAQAAAVYERFVEKLMSKSGQSDGQQGPAQRQRPKFAAGQEEQEGGSGERQLTVSEQVSALIKEATSLDKLAQMYEGWSAWI